MDLPEEAAAYAAADFGDVNEAFVQKLLDLAGAKKDTLVLDLGTGPGDIPHRLTRARPRWRIVGVDASAAMLRIGRARVAGAIHFVLSDAKKLPISGGVFDIVTSNSILHHISDTDALWREVERVVKPGGLVYMRDLLRPLTPVDARELVETYAGDESRLLQEEFHRSLLSAYSLDEVSRQLAQAGFDNCRVLEVTDRHLDVIGRAE